MELVALDGTIRRANLKTMQKTKTSWRSCGWWNRELHSLFIDNMLWHDTTFLPRLLA